MVSLHGTLSDLTVIFVSLGAVLLFGGTIYVLYFIIPILLAKLVQGTVSLYFHLYAKGDKRVRLHISYFRLGLFMRRIHLQNIYFSTAEYTIFVGDVHLQFSLFRKSGFLNKVLQDHITGSQAKNAHSLIFPLFPAVVSITGIDIHLYSRKPLPYEPTTDGLRRYMEECQSKLASETAQRKLPFLFRIFGPMNLEIKGIRLVLSNPYLRCGIRATIGAANGVVGVYQEAELFTFYTTHLDLKLHGFNINFIENEFYNPIFDHKRQNFFEKKSFVPLYCGKNSLSIPILSSPISRLTINTTSDLSKVSFRPGLHSSQDRSEIYEQSFPVGVISIRLIEPKITYSPWIERERKRIFSLFYPETFLPRQVWPLPANDELFFRPTLNYKITVIFDTPGTIQYWYRNVDQPYDPLRHDIILAWKRAQMESARISQQLREFKANSTINYSNGTNAEQTYTEKSITNHGLTSSRGTTTIDDEDCLDYSIARSMGPATVSSINSTIEETSALLPKNNSTSMTQLHSIHSRKGSNISYNSRTRSSMMSKAVLSGMLGQSKTARMSSQGSPLAGAAIDDLETMVTNHQHFQSVANMHAAVSNDELFAQFNVDSNIFQMDNLDEPMYNTQTTKDDEQEPEEQTLKQHRTLWSSVFSNTIPFVNRFIRSSESKGEQEFNIFDTPTSEREADSATTSPPTVGAYTSPHEGISFTCSTGTIILLKVPVFSYFPTRSRKVSAFIPNLSAKTTILKQEFLVAENISFVWGESVAGSEYSSPTKWDVGFFAENFRIELTGAIISQISHLLGDLAEDDCDLLSYYRKSLVPLLDNSTVILAHEFPTTDKAFDTYCNAPPNRLRTIKEAQYSKMKRFIPVEMEFTIRVINYEIGVVTTVDNVCSTLNHLSTVQPVQEFLMNKYAIAYNRLYCRQNMLTEHDFKEIRLVSSHHCVHYNNPFQDMFWRMPAIIGASNRSVYSLLDLSIDVINNDYEQVATLLQGNISLSENLRQDLSWLNKVYDIFHPSADKKRRCWCTRTKTKTRGTLPVTTVSKLKQDNEYLIPLEHDYTYSQHSRHSTSYNPDIIKLNHNHMQKNSSSCNEIGLVPASAYSVPKLSTVHMIHHRHNTSWDTIKTSSTSGQPSSHYSTVDEFLKAFFYESPDTIERYDHKIEVLRIANNKHHANSNPLTYEEYLSLLKYYPSAHSRIIFAGIDLMCGITVPRVHNIDACDENADVSNQMYSVLHVKTTLKTASIYTACSSTSRQHAFLSRLYSAKKNLNKPLVSPFTSGPLPRTELRIGTVKEISLDAHLDAPVREFLGNSLQTSLPQTTDLSSFSNLSYPQDSNISFNLNLLQPEILVNGSIIALYTHFLENLFLSQRFPISEADYIIMPFKLRFKNQLAKAYESYYLYRRLEANYTNDLWLNSIRRITKNNPDMEPVDHLTDRDILIRLSHDLTFCEQLTYLDTVYPVTKATNLYRKFSNYLASIRLFLTIYAEKPVVSVSVHEFTELPHRFPFAYKELHASYDNLFTTSLSDPRGFITIRTQKLTFAIVSSQTIIALSVVTTPLRGHYTSNDSSTMAVGCFDMHVVMPKTTDSLSPLPTRTAYSITASTFNISVYPEFVGALAMLVRNFWVMYLTPSFTNMPTSLIDYTKVNTDRNNVSEAGYNEIYNHIRQSIDKRMQMDLNLLTNQSNFLLFCNYLENLNDSDHATTLYKLYARKQLGSHVKSHQESMLLGSRMDSSASSSHGTKHLSNHPDSACSTVSLSTPPIEEIMYARCPDRLRYLLFSTGLIGD